jgi:hypothetical protein
MNMHKDQITKGSSDAVDLPQIRFRVRGAMNADDLAGEQDDIKKLTKIVEDAFGAIANATGLSDKEVLHVMEDLHVDMLKDVLKEGIHADKLMEGVDMEVLEKGIQDAIKVISLATDLDTQQISDTFTEKKNTNINDIVSRLHDRSQTNREKFDE